MAFDYGYGKLENELIELLRTGAPDFEKAKELIEAGADINKSNSDGDENVLSEIIGGYWYTEFDEDDEACCDSTKRKILNPDPGKSMCDVIRFFLDNGFDVNKNEGRFGAQCLFALVLSTFDRYMIDAIKILLDAGAKNRTVSYDPNDDSTPWNFISTEASYHGCCDSKHALSNLFEAAYEIYQAVEEGRPYKYIDTFEASVGKKIIKVLAESNNQEPVFYNMDLPEFKKDNCFTKNLYFVFEDGFLVSTQYCEFWVDAIFPETELTDVSYFFKDIIGNTIKSFNFDNRLIKKYSSEHYNQPIIVIETEKGRKIKFSTNFGEVSKKDRCAFVEFL